MRAALTLLVVIGFLAGCVGGSAGGGPAGTSSVAVPEPQPDDENGSIKGRVTDDSIQPVAGASVGILELGMEATTDEAGVFVFNGVVPGTYGVAAAKLGFDQASTKVTVTAGAISEVNLILEPVPIEEPYMESFPKKGFWTLAIATLVGVPNTGVANNEHRVNFDVGDDWNTTMVELTWRYSNPGQATTPGAWWNNQATPKGKTAASSVGEVFGKTTPIVAQFHPDETYRGDGYKGNRAPFPVGAYNHNMYVFPLGLLTDETQPAFNAALSGSRSRGVGTSFQQPFEMYITIAYFESPPAGYSALPDA